MILDQLTTILIKLANRTNASAWSIQLIFRSIILKWKSTIYFEKASYCSEGNNSQHSFKLLLDYYQVTRFIFIFISFPLTRSLVM